MPVVVTFAPKSEGPDTDNETAFVIAALRSNAASVPVIAIAFNA